MQAVTQSRFSMHLNPVDLEEAAKLPLPAPWPQLIEQGFHQDLLIRVQATNAYAQREGYTSVPNFLSIIGEGFLKPFDAETIRPADDDPDKELKNQVLNGLQEAADKYGDRISSVVWYSLAYIATRTEPLTQRSILKEANSLPYHYSVVDSVLHAVPKVYWLMLDIHAATYKHSGHILIHNCDCGCSLINMAPASDNDGVVKFNLAPKFHKEATYSALSHLLSEGFLIRELQLPFALGVSPEAAEILALQG